VSDPGLFRLADLEAGVSPEELELFLEFLRQPEVIGIQERQPFPAGHADAGIAGGADAGVSLEHRPDGGPQGSQHGRGIVLRPIIDHDHFERDRFLRQGRSHGLGDKPGSIERRDDDTHQGVDSIFIHEATRRT